ncbi:MAG: hypothetical protein FK731_14125 [Asgard group archaeon]|nr:hypothetical protein [Asgard group archaeon]
MALNNYPISSSMGKWLNSDMITYCQNYEYARLFFTIAGYDIGCGYGPSLPDNFPDWRDACSPTNDSSTIQVNFYYYFGIFGIIGIFIYRRNKRR